MKRNVKKRKPGWEAQWTIDILRDHIDKALHELGVPQPGYPAPVTNAVEILSEALELTK